MPTNDKLKAIESQIKSNERLKETLSEVDSERIIYIETKVHIPFLNKLIFAIAILSVFFLLLTLIQQSNRNHLVALKNRAVVCEELKEHLEQDSLCYKEDVRVLWEDN